MKGIQLAAITLLLCAYASSLLAQDLPNTFSSSLKRNTLPSVEITAQYYVALSLLSDREKADSELTDVYSLDDSLRLEDLVDFLDNVPLHSIGRSSAQSAESLYPVVGLFHAHRVEAEPIAFERISDPDSPIKDKIGAFLLIHSVHDFKSQGDMLQFYSRQADAYDMKARRAGLVKQGLQLPEQNREQPIVGDVFRPISRLQEIALWTESQEAKVARARIIFEAENAVYNAALKKDVSAEIKALEDLKQNHFQLSSSIVIRSLLEFPIEVVSDSSPQGEELRQHIRETLIAIGSSSSRDIIDTIVKDKFDVRLRLFLTSCLVDVAGSPQKAGKILENAASGYEKRAQNIRERLELSKAP